MNRKSVNVEFMLGGLQALLGLLVIILSASIKADLFGIQSSFNLSIEASNFYVMILLAIGSISVIGGILLVYDWWES